MFVGLDVVVDVSIDVAWARFAILVRSGALLTAAQNAYAEGFLADQPGPAQGISRLVEVLFREPVIRGETVVVAVRWEAIGPDGELFHALDADMTLAPAGKGTTALRLEGAYRGPRLGAATAGPGPAVSHGVATATIRGFLSRAGSAIDDPAQGAGGHGRHRPAWRPPETEVS